MDHQNSNEEEPENQQKRNTTRALETGVGLAVKIHVSWNARQGEPFRSHRVSDYRRAALRRHSAAVIRSFITSVS